MFKDPRADDLAVLQAALTYTTEDSALVDALHDWLEAQLGDHGAHAESGH
ncbi:hypothetical protein [Streptomyces sp. NPDC090021]